MNNTPMGYPPRRGIFLGIPPSHFEAVTRKAQNLSDRESGDRAGLASATITSYVKDARKTLQFGTVQELLWAFYAEYAPELIFPVPPLEDEDDDVEATS